MSVAGPSRKTIVQLLKQGYTEIPEIMASSVMAVVGLGFAAVGLRNYAKNDGDNRRYKATYCIMRPEDPRAKRVHKD